MFREMRRKKQQLSDTECIEILKTEKRGALSVLGDGGYPYTIPINFYYDEGDGKLYFHCAKEGHKLDAIARCDKVCFTVWTGGVQEDGDWSYRVKSVVVMGRAALVDDPALLLDRLKKFGMKYYPTETEVDAEIKKDFSRVRMVSITPEHMTGKKVHEK